jgi:hypothetical protein
VLPAFLPTIIDALFLVSHVPTRPTGGVQSGVCCVLVNHLQRKVAGSTAAARLTFQSDAQTLGTEKLGERGRRRGIADGWAAPHAHGC